MKRTLRIAFARIGLIGVLSGMLFVAAFPYMARVSPQPIIATGPNHFLAGYTTANPSRYVPAQSDKPHTMAASYYNVEKNLKTQISLNNKGIHPLEVNPTLFNLSGQRLDVPPVTVDATSFQVFDIAEWAAAGDPSFQQGSLQLFYRGKDLLLGAQLKMVDLNSSLISDEQLSEPISMRSSSLEGLWWIPARNTQVTIAISNTTDEAVMASLHVDAVSPKEEKSRSLALQPNQTVVVDLVQDLSEKPAVPRSVGGVSISHSGAPGSLIARAIIQNAPIGFSSAVQFIDPKVAKSSRLHGAGLRLGEVAGEDLTTVIVSRNLSSSTAILRGRIPYTKNDGSVAVTPLREVHLKPGEVRAWELKEVTSLQRAGVASAGLEFDYDTDPGSVIVSAVSVSRRGSHVFQVPMLDPVAQKSSTGVYPFYLDYGSSTVVYVKNTTAVPQKYLAHLNFDSGAYRIGLKTLKPAETVALDIRELRDSQLPDDEGRTIPINTNRGQVRWTIVQSEGTDLLAMIGRAEHVDEARAISSTYACQNCCDDFVQDVFISPSGVEMEVGQSVTLRAFELRSDCYGFAYPVEQSASWSTSNSSVASVSEGQVTPMSGGQSSITASWNSFSSVPTQCSPGSGFGPGPIGPEPCCGSAAVFRSASATVHVVPRVNISAAQTIMDGSTASFSIESPDATPSSINWSFTAPSGAGNNPDVQFNPNGSTSTTTNGHWFAFPNNECTAPCDSTYTISCTVQFSLGFNVTVTVSTTLTVNGCWNPAGFLDPREARVVGVPAMAPDTTGIWRVTGMGTLGRQIPTKQVFVPSTSQFFTKTDIHEQEHLNHWAPGNLFGNVHQPADFFARIQNFTGTSRQDLINRLAAQFQTYTDEQDAFVNANLSTTERLAHQISDSIAPRYLYQNCGRF